MRILFELLWLICFLYFLYAIGTIEKGKSKRIIVICIIVVLQLTFSYLHLNGIGILLNIGVLVLYDLFYDETPFQIQWRYLILFASFLLLAEIVIGRTTVSLCYVVTECLYLCCLLLFAYRKEYLTIFYGFIAVFTYACLIGLHLLILTKGIELTLFPRMSASQAEMVLQTWFLFLGSLLYLLIRGTLERYQKGYEIRTAKFQQTVLLHQYEEIKTIYLNMRGWRHDYHNHLQVIKANLSLKKYDDVFEYLDQLEQDLDRIDTYVKSGNIMLDAILNSKLSIAEKAEIPIRCDVQVPETIPISDVDLCVMLGNLLDNAIESCNKVEASYRFLRVYILVNGQQFYASIQNSAKEELDFNEANYISTKRGNHGLGLKRVQLLVDHYDGYLNLKNEPGIFASEITIPLYVNHE